MSDRAALLAAAEAELAKRSFSRFVPLAWPWIEPTRALMRSIAFDAITAALQAVADGRIKRLGIACPPGVAKSKLASVAFPAWLLLRTNGTSRVMTASYAHDLATRDAVATRDLVNSPWMRSLVGGAWSVRSDVGNVADDWSTTRTGRRIAVATGAATTGDRATVQICDDLLSARDSWSEAKRRDAIGFLNTVLPSRLEDLEHDPRVLIGQRLHVGDPLSVAIEQGWKMLVLPAVLGPCDDLGISSETEPCVLVDDDGREVWRDPRKPSEPLVDLLSVEALARIKVELGSAAFAAQYLQAPHDDSAGMFARSCFTRRWTELPDLERKCIALDASFKESKSSDYAVIQCFGAKGADRFLIEQWRKRAGFAETLDALRAMVQRHPFAKVLIESAANGHAIYQQISREIAGVVEVKPEGGKIARAASVQGIIESGAVVLPAHAPWVDGWIDEVSAFPHAKHDDSVDAAVYCLRELQVDSDDPVEMMRRANANLRELLDGTREVDPVATAQRLAAESADRQRRRARLDRIEAKQARGEKLSRGEAIHLRMWRRKRPEHGKEQADAENANSEQRR